MSDVDFPALMEPVARILWGEPSKALSTRLQLRWGSQGSKSVKLDGEGFWHDFETGESGGVLKLIRREIACDDQGAIEWLEEQGFIEKRQEPRERTERPEPRPEPQQPPETSAGEQTAVKGYHYTTRDGDPLYDVIRYQRKLPNGGFVIDPKTGNPKKTFRQRRPDGWGGWIWNLDGVGHTIYRHPEVEVAIAEGKTVFLPEGEKDADTFVEWGLCGSTNSGGAQHWTPELAALFKDADVVIPVDNDQVGIEAGEKKARSLKGIAKRIRVLNFAEHVDDFPKKADVTDWKERFGGDASKLDEILKRLPDWRPRPPSSKFGAARMRDLAGSPIVYDWLVKGLIERGGVFMVAAEKQAGKSFFMMDMGMKVARGLDYCGRKVKQGLVIYMACEDGKGVKLRAEGYRRDQGIPEDQDLPFLVMDPTEKGAGTFSLMNDDAVDAFIKECLSWEEFYGVKLELIVIDTLSIAAEGMDEINGAEVGRVLARVNRIASQTEAAVCLVHHMNADGKRVRGHSSLGNNVSGVIELRPLTKPQTNRNLPPELIKDADGRMIRKAVLDKNKNGPNKISWRFVLRQINLGQDADGYPITTCVLDTPSSEPDEGGPKTGRLSPDQKLVLDALRAAVEEKGKTMPSGVRVGPQVRVCTDQQDFDAQVRKVWAFRAGEEDIEARNKELSDAMKRNVTALINAGFMGRDNDHKIVWFLKDDRPKRKEAEPPPALPQDVRDALKDGVPF